MGRVKSLHKIIEMVNMHLILPIKQIELKGVSSSEKNLNVFKREEYYTSLFSAPQNGRKGSMELRGVGGKVSINQTRTICEAVVSE